MAFLPEKNPEFPGGEMSSCSSKLKISTAFMEDELEMCPQSLQMFMPSRFPVGMLLSRTIYTSE